MRIRDCNRQKFNYFFCLKNVQESKQTLKRKKITQTKFRGIECVNKQNCLIEVFF